MKTYSTGERAPEGVYVSLRHLDVCVLASDDGVLNGKPGARYQRVPMLSLLVFAPLLGAIYAFGFPVVIFASFVGNLFKGLAGLRLRRAEEPADEGVYLGFNRLAVRVITSSGETLGGKPKTRYVRIPTLLLLVLSPLLGGLYVVLFPVILAGALVGLFGLLLKALFERVTEGHGHIATFQFQPSAAFLAGKKEALPPKAEHVEALPAEAQVAEDTELAEEVAKRLLAERSSAGSKSSGEESCER